MVAVRDQDQLVPSRARRTSSRGRARLRSARSRARPRRTCRLMSADGSTVTWSLIPGSRRANSARQGRQVVGRAGRAGAEVQRAGLERLHAQGPRLRHDLDRAQRGPAAVGHGTPGVGQPDASPVALEQLQADSACSKLCTCWVTARLGQEEGCGRPRDVLVLGDGDEGPKLLDREGRLALRHISLAYESHYKSLSQ